MKKADKINRAAQTTLSGLNEPALATFRPTSGTPRSSDITKFEANLPVPESGPWAEFVSKAIEAGYAADHANAVWLFASNHFLAPQVIYHVLGYPKRLSPTIVLAGNDISQNSSLRNMVWSVLKAKGNADLITNFVEAQSLNRLCELESSNTLTIIDFARELPPFKKWHAAPKGCLSIQHILDPEMLNVTLQSYIGVDPLHPVAISFLATHPLSSLAALDPTANYIFEQALVIPSFGATRSPVPLPHIQSEMRNCLGQLNSLPRDLDLEASLSPSAQSSWDDTVNLLQAKFNRHKTLGAENSSWYRRLRMFLAGAVEVAIAHAANRDLRRGSAFTPELEAADIIFAKTFMDRLQNSWDALDSIYAETREVEIAETYHRRICSDFADKYKSGMNGIFVKLADLVAKYCQHPKRNGHFSSREFELKIMGELQKSGLAQPHPKLARHWIIYR